jgi:hypothetical protein
MENIAISATHTIKKSIARQQKERATCIQHILGRTTVGVDKGTN